MAPALQRCALAALLTVWLAPEPLAQKVDAIEPNRGGDVDLAARDPQHALAQLVPAEGYDVNLWASEVEFPLHNPVALTFDAKGRMWVATMPSYPQYRPGDRNASGRLGPNDKILILEDTDGDGVADDCTVFADGLHVPTGLELGDGGVYVAQQPNIVFLADTDGDDRADVRRVILHGFGTEDSHHSISAFTWGPGGGLYFQEGTFHHTQVETPWGPVRCVDAGVFRFEPTTHKLSVFVSYRFANPWGHVFDRWGQSFVSDASGGANYFGTAFSGHVEYPRKHRGMRQWTDSTKRPTAGCEFVSSRHFPPEAQGNFLLNNCIGFHGVMQYEVEEDGSGFVGRQIEPLLHSTDINFRPVDLQFGPDGALYICDWFNPLIGHMQYSLRDARRDTEHGRIWRITATGRPLLDPIDLTEKSVPELIELLKEPEDRLRYRVRRELRVRDTETVVAAIRATQPRGLVVEPEDEHFELERLWVHQHLDQRNLTGLLSLLRADDHRARAAATRVLLHWFDRVPEAMDRLRELARDSSPRVRLEVVRACSFLPTLEAAKVALEVVAQPLDDYLEYTAVETMRTLEPHWKPAVVSGEDLGLVQLARDTYGATARELAYAWLTGAHADPMPAYDIAASTDGGILDFLAAVRRIEETDVRTACFPLIAAALADSPPTEQARAAIDALVHVPGHEPDKFGELARFVRDPELGPDAIRTMLKLDAASWPLDGVQDLADTLVFMLSRIEKPDRSDESFRATVSLARKLAALLPTEAGEEIRGQVDRFDRTVVYIEPVPHVLAFDVVEFEVLAGKPVEIVFKNTDVMPHNLLVTAPGALERVGTAAERMATGPDGFTKHFVPDTPEVLWATKLLQAGETEILRFEAPTEPGRYPFVCTFPGHWRTMNGTMLVEKPN